MTSKRTVLLLCITVVLAAVWAYWFAPRNAQAQTASGGEIPTQFKWEYAELYLLESPSQKQTQVIFLPQDKCPRNAPIFRNGKLGVHQTHFSALDILGNLGWEMFQVRPGYSKTEPFRTIYYFKRRKL